MSNIKQLIKVFVHIVPGVDPPPHHRPPLKNNNNTTTNKQKNRKRIVQTLCWMTGAGGGLSRREQWHGRGVSEEGSPSLLGLDLSIPFRHLSCRQVDVRFTPEECAVYRKTKKLLGTRASDNIIAVFTMGNKLPTDSEVFF